MGIYDMKAFYVWLETATDQELVQRRDRLQLAIRQRFTEQRIIKDAKHLLGKIEEEMLARELRS